MRPPALELGRWAGSDFGASPVAPGACMRGLNPPSLAWHPLPSPSRTLYGFEERQRRRRLVQRLPSYALADSAQRLAQTAPRTPLAPCGAEAAERPAPEPAARRGEDARPLSAPPASKADQPQTPAPLTPERAQEIQLCLSAFRDTVLERAALSCSPLGQALSWVASELANKGRPPCSAQEFEVRGSGVSGSRAVVGGGATPFRREACEPPPRCAPSPTTPGVAWGRRARGWRAAGVPIGGPLFPPLICAAVPARRLSCTPWTGGRPSCWTASAMPPRARCTFCESRSARARMRVRALAPPSRHPLVDWPRPGGHVVSPARARRPHRPVRTRRHAAPRAGRAAHSLRCPVTSPVLALAPSR